MESFGGYGTRILLGWRDFPSDAIHSEYHLIEKHTTRILRFSRTESPVLLAFERVGQVAACITAVIFVCPHGFEMPWLLWLLAALMLMILYECAWVRYFKSSNELLAMYAPLGFIPVPIASLPVFAFLLIGIWYLSPFTIASAIILGIGHIGIHLSHLRQLQH